MRSVLADYVNGTASSGSVAAVAAAALNPAAAHSATVAGRSKAAKPTLAATVNGPIMLANGEPYYPRMVGGVTDVDLLIAARDNAMGVGFYGDAGTGKSTAASAAFGADLISFSFNGSTSVSDLVGKWIPDNNAPSGFTYRKGPLTRAVEEGRPFLADEISRAPEETLPALFPLLDARRELVIDDLGGETITAADGFVCIATWNPTGIGVHSLDPALLRRLPIKVEVTHDYGVAERRGASAALLKVARSLETRRATVVANGGYPTWVPSVPNLLNSQKMLDMGLGEEVALGALIAECPEEERADAPDGLKSVIDTVSDVFGVDHTLVTSVAA